VATCGAKAAACGELLRLAAACEGALLEAGGRGDGAAPVFEAPDGVCLPFGCMEAAVAADGKAGALEAALAAADAAVGAAQRGEPGAAAALDARCAEVEAVVAGVALPAEELRRVAAAFPRGCTLIVRSSANVEDLAGMSGAGLYESVPNVGAGDAAALGAAVRRVWASLHARRALLARAAAGVPPRAARMAVAVQRQLAPELSFVLHTAHPLTGDAGVLAAELAPGLGETLASGTRGSGWRLEVDKATGDVSTLAFANFSQALLPAGGAPADVSAAAAAAAGGGGGASLAAAVAARRAAAPGGDGAVAARVVDYSAQELSWSEDARAAAGRRLCAVGRLLEAEFGAAQDVEGCVAGGRLYVVQTRPQP
jgi:phosphoglucan,water dikinase